MFRRIDHSANIKTITLTIEGKEITVLQGETVAAAMLATGLKYFRTTPVSDKKRGPFCMMGICFDCLVEIDGIPNQKACQTVVRKGMQISIQKKEGSLKV